MSHVYIEFQGMVSDEKAKKLYALKHMLYKNNNYLVIELYPSQVGHLGEVILKRLTELHRSPSEFFEPLRTPPDKPTFLQTKTPRSYKKTISKYVKILSNGNSIKRTTGRLSTDYVTNIEGQMNTCVVCGLEYFMQEAIQKRWPFFEGHCEKCGMEKNIN